MSLELVDLTWQTGKKNISGISTQIFIALMKEISVWPTLAASPAVPLDLVTYLANFTMVSGKRFFNFYGTIETGKIESIPQGPIDHHSFQNKVMFQFPQENPTALGTLAMLINEDLVVVVLEPATGLYRVIGNNYCVAAKMQSDFLATSGQKVSDAKGVTFSFGDYANEPAPILPGAPPTS